MIRVLLVGLVLLAGCVSSSMMGPKQVSFNLGEVRAYESQLEKDRPLDVPYLATYRSKNKTLFYLAAAHLSLAESPDPKESLTFKMIEDVFGKENLQVVVVEGIRSDLGDSPSSLERHATECEKIDFKVNCGEPSFAVAKARSLGVKYVGGEPSDRAIAKEISKEGFTETDLLGFYIVREIPQLKRENEFSLASFSHRVESRIKQFRADEGFATDYGYQDFIRWYERHGRAAQKFADLTVDDVAPIAGEGSTDIQKVSHAVNRARDRNVVSVIENQLNLFDRVFVVYGASHLLSQRFVFQRALGAPEYQSFK